VPAQTEWPAVIKSPRTTDVPCVTSDILPTVLDLLVLKHPAPQRPLDGISLRQLFVDGSMKERPSPIGFWKYDAREEKKNPRWVDAELSRGTTPTTSQANIDFTNYRHPIAKTEGFGGAATWVENRYKLSTWGNADERRVSLFDLLADPGETTDVAAQHRNVVQRMTEQLHTWQQSVERSLSGADY